MGLPATLKNLNLFNDGLSYLGQVPELTPPTLGRDFEDYRGGGMNGPVKLDRGMKGIEMEWTGAAMLRDVFRQFGIAQVDGVQLRFAGAYQADDTGAVDAVEIVVRGRHEEIAPGGAKPADNTELKIKTACSYYKLTINGEVLIEIDLLNMVEIVGGVDRLAEQRAAIGL